METRIGNQRPTNSFVPEFDDPTAADVSLKLLDLIGFGLDGWQAWCVRQMLGKSEGKYASRDCCLLVPRQNGKLQRLDAPILTANRGWQTFETLNVGDEVFHPDGRATAVVRILPVDTTQECFRVTTTDGRSELFGGEHLWRVTDKRAERSVGPRGARVRHFEDRIVTTREMFDTGTSRYKAGGRSTKAGGRQYRTNEYRYILPRQCALIDLPKVELPIDPYLLGAWLGDGDSRGAQLTCHVDDLPHMVAAVSEAGFTPTTRIDHGDTWTIGITAERGAGRNSRTLIGKLRELDLLRNKHIPDLFLLAADMQREALLQGLMDTDGYCDNSGQVEFCSVSRSLADGVLFLARSLGWRAVLTEGRSRLNGKDYGPRYRVTWTPTLEDPYVCFRMARKLARVKAFDGGAGRFTVSIKSIERAPTVPMRCIQVEREDGLYLAGRDLIVTHNTRVLEARALAGVLALREDVIFTAQNFSTCRESFYRVKSILESYGEASDDPAFQEPSLRFRESNDNLAIVFRGKRIVYKARGTNPVRGFSPQVVIADEAYAMNDEIAAALQNSLRAQRSPQYICTSSTGLDDSDYLLRMRDRGLQEMGQHSLALMEWCADPGCDLDDVEQWYQSNPALGIRVDLETMENDRRGQADKQFGRECLGLWADNKFRSVVDLDLWGALADAASKIDTRFVIGVDATPSAPHDAAITVAGFAPDGRKQVEVLRTDRGLSWVVEAVQSLYMSTRADPPLAICVQAGAKAGSLIPELEKVRDRNGDAAEVMSFGARDVTNACDFIYDSIEDKSLVHLGDPALLTALSGATKIHVGKLDGPKGAEEFRSWYWGRRDTLVDISPLCAVTYALWGLNQKRTEIELSTRHYEGKPRGGGLW